MKSHRNRKLVRLLVLFGADLFFFGAVNPIRAYSFVVIVGYALLVMTIYALIDLILVLGERVVPFSATTKNRIALATTIVLGLLIAMQSIGQLTVKDILAVVPLVIVLSFYFSYMLRKRG